MRAMRRFQIALLSFASAALVGCERPATSPGQSQQEAMRRAGRGDSLLKAVAAQLGDLPANVETDLRQPTIVLDATPSGEDILAIGTQTPNVPDGMVNYVIVPEGNGRFRSLGVRSGDILKYYLISDETVDEERRASGFSRWLAMEFNIAQVIDENTLLIEKGVPSAVAKEYLRQVGRDDRSLPQEVKDYVAQVVADDSTVTPQIVIPAKIEIWRHLDDRLYEINQKLNVYWERRLPPLGWEPSPDEKVLLQTVLWLNQWLRQSEKVADWRIDPLLESLDPKLRTDQELAPYISKKALEAGVFEPHEGRLLQEAVWMRDISRWARGDSFDDLERAAALFDWTVRNVQLVADEDAVPHRPWKVLLYGRGTAEQRAWVFALLCRQLDLDVVMLATKPPDLPADASQAGQGEARFWLPALVLGEELHLFDTRLGQPIPGPGGQGVATLRQVSEDDALLRQLDLEGVPYPITAEMLKEVTAYAAADWFDLSRRALAVDQKLTGDDRVVLAAGPSALAERLGAVPQIGQVLLWELPFETLRDQLSLLPPARRREVLEFEPLATRPKLWKARLRHFQGRREGGDEQTATEPSDIIDDHGEAAQLYTDKSVRPTDREISRNQSNDKRRVDTTAKLNATYWLGLLSFDDGKYDVAAHWFGRPELSDEGSPWAHGARYNLARTYEAQGNLAEAIALLEQDASSQQHGNKLRARRLKSRLDEAKKSEE
jgi:tetratricopeptide (TPR) repeat protein